MQSRFDIAFLESQYASLVVGKEWHVPSPIESPMDIVKRELWIRDNKPSREATPVDYFLFGRGEPEDPTCTKFGGVPYRSASHPWPGLTAEEEYPFPFEFFCQINFSESRDIVPELPSDLLLVFLVWEDGALTDDYYFEWAKTSIPDPISAENVPEQQFGMVKTPTYCELHRSNEFSSDGFADGDAFRTYGSLAVSKIGGVSDYFNAPPDLPGIHLFTLCSASTSRERVFPYLNQTQYRKMWLGAILRKSS